MVESTIGVLLYLSVALLIGVILGWHLTNRMKHKEELIELDVLQKHYNDKEHEVKKLQENYIQQKQNLDRLTDEGIVCRHQLLQKSNFLTKKSDELFKIQDKLKEVTQIQKERNALEYKVSELNMQLREKEEELKEFEKVLLKVDRAISQEDSKVLLEEAQELSEKQKVIYRLEAELQRVQQLLENREAIVHSLQEELTAFKSNKNDWDTLREDHIMMSKDQLGEIEKRLAEYTEQIQCLEEEKNKLLINSQQVNTKKHLLTAFSNTYEEFHRWTKSTKEKFVSNYP